MRCFLACALFLALEMPVAAQVYKWVDANGVTHYSERPQPSGNAKELKLRDASPRQQGAAAASPSLTDKELEFRKRQTTRSQEAAMAAQEKAVLEQKCRNARAALNDLQATHRIFERDANGERVFLSDAQRDALVAKRQAEYSRNCG